ncbi:MAG: SycD/LcrH family type III secretion system chaperone [Chlamydiales bacterium]|nr:SycD/LcrH family type III secretion system chaperone [Chlamydiales bacterium]
MTFMQSVFDTFNGYDLNKEEDLERLGKHIGECIIEKNMVFKDIFHVPEEFMLKLHTLAYSLYEAGKYKIACGVFNKLMMLDPKSFTYALGAAVCLDELKEYPVAINFYGYAFLNNVEDPTPLYRAGECCLKMNDPTKAKQFFEQAITVAGELEPYKLLKVRSEIILKTLSEIKK